MRSWDSSAPTSAAAGGPWLVYIVSVPLCHTNLLHVSEQLWASNNASDCAFFFGHVHMEYNTVLDTSRQPSLQSI